ncbi:hypothetical protein OHAE_1791 [Ochrobactrum soli]|uniref:Uncharacterized protein n=1 Tax=Ochrobactrum soli TaxID=2448455 RepID=A0A2P9HP87_9HYPH|nr:hypothetical protein OHAE_1791 [[Ochrobactrum] soli]
MSARLIYPTLFATQFRENPDSRAKSQSICCDSRADAT